MTGYSIPTITDYLFFQLTEAKNASVSNLLQIMRSVFPDMTLDQPYFYYKGKKYKFFFDVLIKKQNFERIDNG